MTGYVSKRQAAWDKYSTNNRYGTLQWEAFESGWNAALAQPEQERLAKVEPCAVCGEGKARLLVVRNCDTCHSEYAGQAEMKVALGKLEQEPVAHVYLFDHEGRPRIAFDNAKGIKIGDKLYTTPPKRQPLTDEIILHFVDLYIGVPSPSYPLNNSDWINFARAIEAALRSKNT